MSDMPKVRLSGLYKIFGARHKDMMPHVKAGMGKPELLENPRACVGSARHQCRHASGRDHGCNGSVGLREIDSDPSPEPFD